ncbi:MAG: sulfite exporter TauE/SafE family protein [Bacteroidetes bacterium]|nr:sulfite exporter TauE/SafE family protein [Bacteroidota bacterium]MBP6402374.1 sulfite exporter TauE/SafE family protein [Bacteroidia bacterium]MBK6837428.1 sulfite exporter TauE/SafE family protein [Bacteroidota bacterium]MBK9523166.1 sulfite exporter TauE/SafE family protein [Bacteroidota bacterium]MBK9540910.1 sulfite exporter TauE/SafE family protein [Bacteroidota bacterium]
MWLFSAFLVGFLGSFHCVGMCGPIALALPLEKKSNWSFFSGRLLYNGGRVLTYSVLGLLVGIIGHTIAMAGFQKVLSIATGILILIIAMLPFLIKRVNYLNLFLVRYTSKIKGLFKVLFGLRSRKTLFLIGVVNGLLPCGFVYLALAGAATTGTMAEGMSYMLLFGLGTVPMMLTLTMAGNIFSLRTRMIIQKISPFIAVSVAILLIARGLTIDNHSCCQHH